MKGKVYLVGAGPGNAGLITAKGLELLKKAEVLVYDRLAGSNLVSEAPDDCEMIYVGKKSNQHTMKQEDINQILVDKALENKLVVRLKGGDPYVFGRGGEEAVKLYDHAIPFEVVPGITSPIGGLCYAGIPITHRDVATSFHVITGHLKEDGEAHDWEALSRLKGTIVFLMGMSNLEKIAHQLIENGMSKDKAVAIVHWASHPHQQVVEGTLENIVDRVKKSGVTSPSLIVVGDVVKLRKPLNFFERKPLHGKHIVVTRATSQSSGMMDKIRELGGAPIALPMIQIKKLNPLEALNKVMQQLHSYHYLIFTSINGIHRFFEELDNFNLDARALAGMKIVCVGEPTQKALKEKGINVDIVPKRFVAEGVLETLLPKLKPEDRILLPRAKGARPLLVDALAKVCSVDELKLYQAVAGKPDWSYLDDHLDQIEFITFTSASTVKNFVDAIKDRLVDFEDKKIISIGPITTKEILKHGLKVHKEAEVHTIDGMIDVILSCIEEKE